MSDTPDHIKKIQLELWLAKSPMERLRQMMQDNEALLNMWKHAKPSIKATSESRD